MSADIDLKYKSGVEFFDLLQGNLDFTIPPDIKRILLFNYYDSAIALSKFDSDSVKEVEIAMRTDFIKDGRKNGRLLVSLRQKSIKF